MDKIQTSGSINALIDKYSECGLYMIFDDGEEVNLSRSAVEQLRSRMETDESMVQLLTRTQQDFKTCSICPAREHAAMCHALPAIIPFVSGMKARSSFDSVIAVYVDDSGEQPARKVIHAGRTSLSRAMQYVAIQSVLWHCETGRLYFKYLGGVLPFSSANDIAERIYANVMLEHGGDAGAVDCTLSKMVETLMIAMQCQVRRVALVAESDVFANAFVNLYLALDLLKPERRMEVRSRMIGRNQG